MATVPAEVPGPSDAELIAAVHDGNLNAFGTLYERHVTAAYNLARQLARSSAEADDLVSEAFAQVLDTLRAGRGPDLAFRAYLLTALRHIAYNVFRKDKKLALTEDVVQVSGVRQEEISEPFRDTAVAGLERTLAARAFARLPERWQAVLWHIDIERQTAAEIAPLLGLTPNGVSALSYRAREGLRQAYLQVNLADTTDERCRTVTERLGAWTRGGLSKRDTAQVEKHLDECDRCRALAAELADLNSSLRTFIAPLVLGMGAAGYLAATAAKATATGAAVAGVSTGAAAGAVHAAAGGHHSVGRHLTGIGTTAGGLAVLVAAFVLAAHGGQSAPPPGTVRPTGTQIQQSHPGVPNGPGQLPPTTSARPPTPSSPR